MPASEQKTDAPAKLPGLFMSYRRSDTPDAVGRIYDRLVSEFGKARVFKDVDSIPLGQDFRGHLNDIVGGCAAVLAIIGPRWTDTRNAAGQRRLEDPEDFVRIELEAALSRDIPVVPVLVGHAAMPGSAELPASLTSIAYRQSIEVRPDPDFHNDATRLVSALQKILDPNAPDVAPHTGRKRSWAFALTAAAFLLIAGLAFLAWTNLRSSPLPEIRTEISTPEADRPQDFALSPDGRYIAFAARDGEVTRLWLRSLASEDARSLPGTEGAREPFWSPDSGSIAFFTPTDIKRFDIKGGVTRVIVELASEAAGGSWGSRGVILFGTGFGIALVREAGGEAVAVTQTDRGLHVQPQFLPDGHRFLYTEVSGDGTAIFLASLDGGEPVKLVAAGNGGAWLPPGRLIWEDDGALYAQQLDLGKAALVGHPVVIADRPSGLAGRAASVSSNGLIAFRRAMKRPTQLFWFDRSGTRLGAVGVPQTSYLSTPRISPDGRRVAAVRTTRGNQDLWLFDGPRLSRLTDDPGLETGPQWLSGGREIAYAWLQSASTQKHILRQSIDGTGAVVRLTDAASIGVPASVSQDGRYLLYDRLDASFSADLFLLSLEGKDKPVPWLQTSFREQSGSFSPDGRWIAYSSNASGRPEVYVRAFNPPDGQGAGSSGSEAQLISTAGGTFPTWRGDSREIFFLGPKGEMMAATASVSGSVLSPGTPVRLFATRIAGGGAMGALSSREYDVAPDGRFLINTELDDGVTPPITLIQNWNPDAGE